MNKYSSRTDLRTSASEATPLVWTDEKSTVATARDGYRRQGGSAARDSGGYLEARRHDGHRPLLQAAPSIAILLGILWLFGATLPSLGQSNLNDGQAQSLPRVTLHIGKATLSTEIASTEPEQERGLMYRTSLADNDGMIFLLPEIGPATFWMKNTLIPLSVAFIDKDGVILEIHDMQPGDPHLPDSDLPLTRSDSNQIAYALETNLHWFALNGIKPGEKIDPPPATLAKTPAME